METTTAPAPQLTRLAPLLAFALFVAYSIIVTMTSGSASFAASPMLVAAIGLLVWHDRSSND